MKIKNIIYNFLELPLLSRVFILTIIFIIYGLFLGFSKIINHGISQAARQPHTDTAIVIILGQCDEHECSATLNNGEFILSSKPMSLGQTMYKRCRSDKPECYWSVTSKVYK